MNDGDENGSGHSSFAIACPKCGLAIRVVDGRAVAGALSEDFEHTCGFRAGIRTSAELDLFRLMGLIASCSLNFVSNALLYEPWPRRSCAKLSVS